MQFRIGDLVRVVREVPSRSNGWNNTWVGGMDQFIGADIKYPIDHINSYGVYFTSDVFRINGDDDPRAFGWPPHALELQDKQMRLF